MEIGRRDFIKVISAGAITATTAKTALAQVRKQAPPNAPGILYDGTLCIGCKACEVGCKKQNNMPIDQSAYSRDKGVAGIWDEGGDLNSRTLNKIKVYNTGTAEYKDREVDGYAFVKRACMHCIDPDCVSACPVSALTKNSENGIVQYNKDACIGCRYCQIACPFNIPKFEYEAAIPEIVKCEFCAHVQTAGGIPGCCEYCPTGASLFGNYSDLLDEAHKRLQLEPGSSHNFPIQSLISNQYSPKTVSRYVNYVYGEKETGGTQYLLLSAIPFAKLGLPSLPQNSSAAVSEDLQHTIYSGLFAPIGLLLALMYAAHRSMKHHENKEEVA
jgi:Fe-S-cluster-containing dehydrogenase component